MHPKHAFSFVGVIENQHQSYLVAGLGKVLKFNKWN